MYTTPEGPAKRDRQQTAGQVRRSFSLKNRFLKHEFTWRLLASRRPGLRFAMSAGSTSWGIHLVTASGHGAEHEPQSRQEILEQK